MIKEILRKVASTIPYDERLKFHDHSKLTPDQRISKSDTLNFYSSVHNIGNYTPIMGIHKFLNKDLDVWCVHDRNIDWTFINKNYKRIIIGGAGLFCYGFDHFWEQIYSECKIPFIIWGVGGCFPKNKKLHSTVDNSILKKATAKADLINLRDNLSANLINRENIIIAPCPTIYYMNDLRSKIKPNKKILYSSHEELLSTQEKLKVTTLLKNKVQFGFTDNIQKKYFGLEKVLNKYLNSNHVITTRLHGAIIAYGLGIPYTAISFDYKVDEFHKLYGNGVLVNSIDDLMDSDFSRDKISYELLEPDLKTFNLFGQKVVDWMSAN